MHKHRRTAQEMKRRVMRLELGIQEPRSRLPKLQRVIFFVFSYQNNVFSRKHLANKGRKCSWNISTFHWNPIVYTAKVRVKRTSYARPAGCSNVHRWNLQTYMCHFYKPSNLARSLSQCKVSTVILYYRRDRALTLNKEVRNQTAVEQPSCNGSGDKHNLWESSAFKLIASMSMLILFTLAKRWTLTVSFLLTENPDVHVWISR